MQKMSLRSKIFLFFLERILLQIRKQNRSWDPRKWSNRELSKFSSIFTGPVVNISAWEDRDKEGSFYRNYFSNSEYYCISNKGGARGESGSGYEIKLDLEQPRVGEKWSKRFQVVLNHTVLEHVYDVRAAVENLACMSNDVIITIAPFMQIEHWEEGSYGDYWRFTQHSLEALFSEHGFSPVYVSSNHNPVYPIYFFQIVSRDALRWKREIRGISQDNLFGELLRTHIATRSIGHFSLMK